MHKLLIPLVLLLTVQLSDAQTPIEYFLPSGYSFDSSIPDPNEFSGYSTGDWHFSHDQVVAYAREVARKSDRATIFEYGRSWENRPMLYMVFTSPANQANLDELRQKHLDAALKNEKIPGNPLVINLGYGVHGNESSGTNSSLLTIYFLAAAKGGMVEKLLDECILLVDPCLNPDGFTRHSTWVNSNRSKNLVSDPAARGFNEPWPGARTNHYLFDLNRDYIPLVNPETIGRIENFHNWLPNIYTDHHEMGANSSFFFQPGVESRNNPLTPYRNYELTKDIAGFHTRALDEIGSLYFTEEQFDDYYFGKGSSYPDINAGIGILFEQAGFRGHLRETDHGLKSFAFAMKNQFTVTLSSLEAGLALKNELLEYQAEFYRTAGSKAASDPVKAYIFGDEHDARKLKYFTDLLLKHRIEVRQLKKELSLGGHTFYPGKAFIVECGQRQYRLIKSFFEPVRSFSDTTFYDISTWTLPYTFNLDFAGLNDPKILNNLRGEIYQPVNHKGWISGEGDYALLMRWDDYTAPAVLYSLLKEGIRAYVAEQEFTLEGIDYSYGTVMIPLKDQDEKRVMEAVNKIIADYPVEFSRVSTGLSDAGINLGSGSLELIRKPEIALLTGEGTNPYNVGETWYQLDQRFNVPATLLDTDNLNRSDLSRYNVIILLSRRLNLEERSAEKLKEWLNNGGSLVTWGGSLDFLEKTGLLKPEKVNPADPFENREYNYSERRKAGDLHRIAGAIYEIEADITHPLFYGYHDKNIPVFKNSELAIQPAGKGFGNPAHYSGAPLLSGYSSTENIKRIAGSAYAIIQSYGRGNIIYLVDDPNFRGMWYGTGKIFANSIFFGNLVR